MSLYSLSGALYSLSGLSILLEALYSIVMYPHPNLSPPGPRAAAAVAQGGAGGPPSIRPLGGRPPP